MFIIVICTVYVIHKAGNYTLTVNEIVLVCPVGYEFIQVNSYTEGSTDDALVSSLKNTLVVGFPENQTLIVYCYNSNPLIRNEK